MFDVGDLPVPVLTFGNCVLKTGVIKWPLKLYVPFFRFFSTSRKTWLFTFFELLHTFSRTLYSCDAEAREQWTLSVDVGLTGSITSGQFSSVHVLWASPSCVSMSAVATLALPDDRTVDGSDADVSAGRSRSASPWPRGTWVCMIRLLPSARQVSGLTSVAAEFQCQRQQVYPTVCQTDEPNKTHYSCKVKVSTSVREGKS